MDAVEGMQRVGSDGSMLQWFICGMASEEVHSSGVIMRSERSRREADDALCGSHVEHPGYSAA